MPRYRVHISANAYDGKWYNYHTVAIPVIAKSPEAACDIVNSNKSTILTYLDKKRTWPSNKRLVMKGGRNRTQRVL